MDRRDFLKTSALVGAGVAAMAACGRRAVRSEQQKPEGEMSCRELNGDRVSMLGYGCMRFRMIKNEDGKDVPDQENINALIDYALEHGVNYFDTAPVYLQGQSEAAVGIALGRHPRSSYYIATKLSTANRDLGDKMLEESVKMYKRSFEHLRTDYIDYYLLHAIGGGGGGEEKIRHNLLDSGVLEYFKKERQAGRIRQLGFSFHGKKDAFDYLMSLHDKEVHWDFVQIQMNYADWRHASNNNTNAEHLYNELAKRNIPAIIMEPLLGGRLADLPDKLSERLKTLRPEDSIASWSFRYNASYPMVMTCLSGMTYMEHLVDNIKTFSPLVPCSEEDKEMLHNIASVLMEYKTVPCTDCQYCMPCPYGINIPGIFSYYNKRVNEGGIAANANDGNYRRARREFLIGYDRAIPTLRQANHCIGCRKCVERCPQGINIPVELMRIDRYVEKLKRNK